MKFQRHRVDAVVPVFGPENTNEQNLTTATFAFKSQSSCWRGQKGRTRSRGILAPTFRAADRWVRWQQWCEDDTVRFYGIRTTHWKVLLSVPRRHASLRPGWDQQHVRTAIRL